MKARRVELGLSVRTVSQAAGLDLSHWQRVERGAGNPTLLTLLRIAVALEVGLDELVAGLGADDVAAGMVRPLTVDELSELIDARRS